MQARHFRDDLRKGRRLKKSKPGLLVNLSLEGPPMVIQTGGKDIEIRLQKVAGQKQLRVNCDPDVKIIKPGKAIETPEGWREREDGKNQ
jgi:hypothetical protein